MLNILYLTVTILGLSDALFWGLILAFTVIAELATLNLVSIWFAAAALVALIIALLNGSLVLQFAVFIILSVAGFLIFTYVIRPKLGKRVIIPTNADRINGKEGVVLEMIDSKTARGLIKVEGQIWSARIVGDGVIPEGTRVLVIGIRGAKATVEPINGAIEPFE